MARCTTGPLALLVLLYYFHLGVTTCMAEVCEAGVSEDATALLHMRAAATESKAEKPESRIIRDLTNLPFRNLKDAILANGNLTEEVDLDADLDTYVECIGAGMWSTCIRSTRDKQNGSTSFRSSLRAGDRYRPMAYDTNPRNPKCNDDEAWQDLYKPLAEVNKAHSTIDGFCYFSAVAPWTSLCAASMEIKDYRLFPYSLKKGYIDEIPHDEKNPSIKTIGYDGGMLKTNNKRYPYDDFYCHGNGWTELPVNEIQNYSMWTKRAEDECKKLAKEFPDYMEFSFKGPTPSTPWEVDDLALQGNIRAGGFGGDPPTKKDARRHAAWKCAMGGLGCDMAYCASNFCSNKHKAVGPRGNPYEFEYIGHGSECKDNIFPGPAHLELDAIREKLVDGKPFRATLEPAL